MAMYNNELISAESSLWDCSKWFTLQTLAELFIPTPTTRVLWKHSATLQLLCKDYSFTYPPVSIARYSFIQLNDQNQREVNETAYTSKQLQ